MGVYVKRVTAWMLTLALVLGCFTGVDMTAEAAAPVIWTATASETELSSNGGNVKVTVKGEELGENIWYMVRVKPEDGYYEEFLSTTTAATTDSTSAEFDVTIPANTQEKALTYQIRVNSNEPGMYWDKSITVKVAASTGVQEADKTELKAVIAQAEEKEEASYTEESWTAMQEKLTEAKATDSKEDATQEQVDTATRELKAAILALVEKQAVITEVIADAETVGAGGGTVTLSVTGTDLTENNWGVEVKKYLADFDMDVTDKPNTAEVTVVSQTAEQVVLDISANGMKNDINLVFSVGPKADGKVTEAKTVTVRQSKKDYDTEEVNIPNVGLADDRTIVATYDVNLTAATEGDDLKKLIYYTDKDGKKCILSTEDEVSVDGQKVVVRMKDAIDEKINSTSCLYIKEGALKLENGNIVRQSFAYIQTKAMISTIVLDQETFDSKGGTINARLEGFKPAEIELDKIFAEVYEAGEVKATSIEITKGHAEDGVPLLTFTVPENTTEKTLSYWLNVKVDGVPVYEASSMNRAARATVSVLPEGKTDKDATLSMLTISGNNKEESDNIKDISVRVSKNVGELKTALRLYGTNLDPKLTKVRAIDENGIIWPVYDIPECDGTFRFVAIAGVNKNGVFGEGNTQLVEVLPPRYIGVNKRYEIQVAIDGVHYDTENSVFLTVLNEGMEADPEFTVCGKDDIKEISVKYIDEETQEEIADTEIYKGYSVSMFRGFDIKEKEIPGYELVSAPEFPEFVGDENTTYTYVYRNTTPPTPPTPPAPVEVKNIKVKALSNQIAAGKNVQLYATVTPSNAENKAVVWRSSNRKYATVSATGKVTTKKAGAGKTVTITATAKDGSGVKATYKISIKKDAVKSISLKAPKSVKAGKKATVKATVKTTGKNANKKLVWSTSNKKYATVSSKGVVTTYKAGRKKTVTITAKATDGSNKKKTIKIKIQ